MDLNSLIIIDKIAKLGSFTAAAKELGIPNSNLSLKIKKLEEDLGQPLFTRSTRKVLITEFGAKIRESASPLASIEEQVKAVAEIESKEPVGRIRVTTAYDIGLYLLRESMPAFTRAYPQTQVEFSLTNQYVNIIEKGYDFAIRATSQKLEDSSTLAVKLGGTTLSLYCARSSPFTKIKDIATLENVPLMHFGNQEIKLSNGKVEYTLKTHSPIRVKDMSGIKEAVIGGVGVGLLPEFVCRDEHSKSALVQILPQWSGGKASFYAICPGKRSLNTKNRYFLEHLKSHFSEQVSDGD